MLISSIDSNLGIYTEHLKNLLAATPVKYSDWPKTEKNNLKKLAGIYHFFEKNEKSVDSLYVGKAGFGANNSWNLYKRLSQHFQISQKNTLIGKIAKSSGESSEKVKASLVKQDVYLQWLAFTNHGTQEICDIESELIWIECFCKSLLKPKYTDA